MELCLGTVQFGMDYGICNQKKPSLDEAVEMLDYATQNGISAIDTASAYGVAEDVVGEFLSRKTISREKLFISSKFKPNLLDECETKDYYKVLKENILLSFKRMNIEYLDAYLLHSSRYVFNEAIMDALYMLKKEGLAGKVGVSVYEVDEAKKCIDNPKADFMQLPFSIFDQRMLQEGVFSYSEGKNTQIHSRSAFIQGLILMDESQVPPFLEKAKPIVKKIDKLCKEFNISKIELAMCFVKNVSQISHLVFGVDNIEQLKEDIQLFNNNLSSDLVIDLSKEFQNIETDIVMPSLWKK